MTLVRWDPFRELEEVSDRLNRMFARPSAPRATGKEIQPQFLISRVAILSAG